MGSADDDEAFAKKVNARFQSFRKGEATAAGELDVHVAVRAPVRPASASQPTTRREARFFFLFFLLRTVGTMRVGCVFHFLFSFYFPYLKTCCDRGV